MTEALEKVWLLIEAAELDVALVELESQDATLPPCLERRTQRGIIYLQMGNALDAMTCLQEVLEGAPDNIRALVMYSDACDLLGERDEALRNLNLALELEPSLDVAILRRAELKIRMGNLLGGLEDYKVRHKLFPARVGLAMEAGGWPEWQGQCIAGKRIVLAGEQGLGDTVQIMRFVRFVEALGACVILGLHLGLHAICRQSGFKGDLYSIVPADVDADYQAALMDVPLILKLTDGELWAGEAYLSPDFAKVMRHRKMLRPARLRIGIAWQGSQSFAGDSTRSIPLSAFKAISGISGVALYSLQAVDGLDQLTQMQSQLGIHVFSGLDAAPASFLESADLMVAFDLIITPDTAVGHVAGALGCPAWLALSRRSDARWRDGQTETPWYPRHRLFRQSIDGDWTGVLRDMRASIYSMLDAK
ncbi:tetratricopeptide repeat protein [Falsihalocynthiibacter arcticus]|uniref:Uncharacterized protein n=1 Tax=Falsihalocynthiibacter arcticus TaxID=1579316 RepID=A0A126V121_9RHOB|nr:hypothetical protein [Falsihalocynthiibacter arcticus]AML51980.1 hypothetical protein RC74_12500 [Falsihalocynthiibacter arcticus]